MWPILMGGPATWAGAWLDFGATAAVGAGAVGAAGAAGAGAVVAAGLGLGDWLQAASAALAATDVNPSRKRRLVTLLDSCFSWDKCLALLTGLVFVTTDSLDDQKITSRQGTTRQTLRIQFCLSLVL